MKKYKLPVTMTDRQAGFGLAYLIFELFFLPSLLIALAGQIGLDDSQLNCLYYCLNFLFCLMVFRSFLKKNLVQAGKRLWQFLLSAVLGFFVYELSNAALSYLVTLLSPGFSNVNDASVAAMASTYPVMMGVSLVILVPFAEECLFRGVIFGKLKPVNTAVAYAVSVLCFCGVHVLGYVGHFPAQTLFLCFVQYIPAGLILARVYEYSGSIFAPMVIHAAVNALSLLSLR